MNICIVGDLAGQVVEFDKRFFDAKEVEENKTSEYYKQRYIVGDDEYGFWISADMKLCDATDQIEVYIYIQAEELNLRAHRNACFFDTRYS